MAKNMWSNNHWGERRGEEYYWQDIDGQKNYSWLKKIIIAAVIFTIVYCAHESDTTIGKMIDNEVRYSLAVQTDFDYVMEQIISHAPANLDLSVLKKVQMAVSKPADPLLYMIKPVNGRIITTFGWHVNPISKEESMYEGIDIEATLGSNIKAAADGKVKAITESAQYGKTLIIAHSQDVDTVYGHLGEIIVNQGDLISQGQIIGKVRKTGITSKPVLYFGLRDKGQAIDPVPRLKGDFPIGEGK